ncbi:MAG: phosphate ABC transporter substrate-binding protein [Bacteroidetes bacterium RIFCSPLOWO2_12_FULL_35_15]|nr:MAG: phosphate ABC transporter substrate-binding protein [Bacteroidetes bacterium RIFCSPLOWO2_12_FULL_35_15]
MKSKVLIIALSLYTGVSIAQKLKGSDTVLPLAQKEAESYLKVNKANKVTVTGGGSGVGLAALVDGTTDIAMSSRKIKMSEKIKLQDAGKASKEIIVAYDALAVIVNPSNKVAQLTREQLEGIFTGKIKNWKEVGGDDLQIVVYSRESSSGTYEFFKEHVLKNKNYASSVLSMPATGAIVQSISQTKGAIGYVGLAYVEKEIKTVKVSYDKGKTYVAPSMASAKDKSYPVVRPLYYYYLTTMEKSVKPFVDFCLSPEGQKIVEQVGYVPLTK